MFCFNTAHNVGYLCISIFFCNPNHIKTAVESTMLCVCFCKNVVEMCCRYEFLCIYFFKITIAYILQDLPLPPAMVLCIYFRKRIYWPSCLIYLIFKAWRSPVVLTFFIYCIYHWFKHYILHFVLIYALV